MWIFYLCKTPWPWQNATPLHSWYMRVYTTRTKSVVDLFHDIVWHQSLCMCVYLNDLRWDVILARAEAFDVLLEIGVHVLENQIQDCLPFFILALFQIQQPARIGRGVGETIHSQFPLQMNTISPQFLVK